MDVLIPIIETPWLKNIEKNINKNELLYNKIKYDLAVIRKNEEIIKSIIREKSIKRICTIN